MTETFAAHSKPVSSGASRLEQLDSLRGLAALSVMIHHYLLVFPVVWQAADPVDGHVTGPLWLRCLTFTPLHVLWTGHEAVVFFFILSGFVLALPFLKSPPPYAAYAAKRFLRIYPPYLVAIVAAIVAVVLTYRGGIPELSYWFNLVGQRPLDWRLVRDHVLFLGTYENTRFNPVIWSLIHELRISLVFPLLMLAVRRWRWPANLGLALVLGVFNWWMIRARSLHTVNYHHDYFETVAYAGFFILGALLAKHRDELCRGFARFSRGARAGFVALGILAYTHGWWLTRSGLLGGGRLEKILRLDVVADWGVALGIVIFILAALSSRRATGWLAGRFPQFLGRISYSLYLYHAVCLITLLNLFHQTIPPGILLVLAAAASFGLAAGSYRWVEEPFIRAGRRLAEKLK